MGKIFPKPGLAGISWGRKINGTISEGTPLLGSNFKYSKKIRNQSFVHNKSLYILDCIVYSVDIHYRPDFIVFTCFSFLDAQASLEPTPSIRHTFLDFGFP